MKGLVVLVCLSLVISSTAAFFSYPCPIGCADTQCFSTGCIKCQPGYCRAYTRRMGVCVPSSQCGDGKYCYSSPQGSFCTGSSLIIHKKYGTKTLDSKVRSLTEAGDVPRPSHYQHPDDDNKNVTFSPEEVEKLLVQMESDEPLNTMEDPYAPKPRRCILCKYYVDINYKNAQLLSQFISPHTGRIYGRRVTGLCIPMQKQIAKLIKRARIFGFMAHLNKDVEFYEDESLVDRNRSKGF